MRVACCVKVVHITTPPSSPTHWTVLSSSPPSGIVDSVLEGVNCSVFAYGVTGAGKTHTKYES